MSKFTKEQLIARLEHQKEVCTTIAEVMADRPGAVELAMIDIRLAEIALAALTADPVAWDYEWASCITCEGPQNFKPVIDREAPPEWAVDEGQARNVIPLYRHALPAPVVTDEREAFEAFMEDRFKDCVSRERVKNGDQGYFAWDMVVAWIVWQGRAAMFNHNTKAVQHETD